jgi:predicted lipoprotein with Yx(FWY)xxD motif
MNRRMFILLVSVAACRDRSPVKDLGGRSLEVPIPSIGVGATAKGMEKDISAFPRRAKQDPSLLTIRSGSYGDYLVDANGRALYSFSEDARGQTACLTNCATVWPPVVAERLPRVETPAIDATKLELISRPNGSRQLSYANMPLYYSESDFKADDTWGHYAMSFGGRFTLVSPGGKPLPPPK